MRCVKFKPIYQDRVWGGRELASVLGRALPGAGPIGESWEIVDRTEANSAIEGAAGSLGALRRERTAWLMGPDWAAERPFPILVKWLDCNERLSLQVHPPAEVAPQLGGEPKTENWYIVKARPGAGLLAGLKRGVTRAQFEAALAAQTLETCVCRLESRVGDSLFVRSGRLHAIDGGNLILEIQQNSDTTYRVYDWGRVGLDGKPRALHVAESMASIDFDDFEPALTHAAGAETELVDAPEFRLRRKVLEAGECLAFAAGVQTTILSVVEGAIEEAQGVQLRFGDNAILPYAEASEWRAKERSVLLITDGFN